MISRVPDEEVSKVDLKTCCDIEDFTDLEKKYQVDESGIVFLDDEENIIKMYMTDSVDETKKTMLKVDAILELGEDEVTKFNKVRHIIKGTLEIMFRNKILVFLLSLAFIYMVVLGIKDRYYFLIFLYTWGFFKITDVGEAKKFLKEATMQYKLREEAMQEEDFMKMYSDIFNSSDIKNIMMYMKVKK